MRTERYVDWLFDTSGALASLIDASSRFERVSHGLAARLGYDAADLVGRRPESLCTPVSLRELRESYRPLLRRTGALDAVPIEFTARNGEVVSFVVSSFVDRAAPRSERRSFSVYTEIGERGEAVRRFRNYYYLSPTMLHTMDPDGTLLDVSERWLRNLGYRRSEVIGRNIRQFLSEDTRERLATGDLPLISRSAEYMNHPREMIAADGRVVEVLMSARAERDAEGVVQRLYVASKDVTERNENVRQLRATLEENARLRTALQSERDYLREEVDVSMNFGRIVGSSPALMQLLARIEAVAQTLASVLIVGESGTGKELVAHAIHAASARADKPLVKVNCASVPDELFESEFFGHVKGAFTGAHRDRVGRFALADGGTIFLDEVGEIPLNLQGKLLRVLQEREFERVGDDRTRTVDVRVIAATNRDLESEVAAGRFREDLFYRLSVFPVSVPPLRERGEDVVQLAAHLLGQIGTELGVGPLRLTAAQAATLREYDWPGNVRELRNTLERAAILARDGRLRLDLPQRAVEGGAAAAPVAPEGYLTAAQMKAFERDNIVRVLEQANWRVSGSGGAAERLGLRPSTLSGRIKALGIERPRLRRGRPRGTAA